MRILITGATGFVGSELTRTLARAGHETVALSRDPGSAQARVPQLGNAFAWAPGSVAIAGDALVGVDAVVHLAGEPVVGRWNRAKRQAIRDSRVVGTRELVDAMRAATHPPAVLVAASAIGYYGDRGDEELDESTPPGNDFLATVCQQWEAESFRATESGVRVVALRIGVVIGQGGGALDAMLLPFKLGIGGPMGSGRQWWSWIHRDDLVGMVRHAIESPELEGAYNATAPAPLRQREFGKVLGKVLRRPSFMPTPALALKLALGGFSSELLSSKRVLPSRMLEAGYRFEQADLERALCRSIT